MQKRQIILCKEINVVGVPSAEDSTQKTVSSIFDNAKNIFYSSDFFLKLKETQMLEFWKKHC